jgi:fatty acid desaturase
MILREDIQHSNTPQGKFIDTRDFEGNRLIKSLFFPLSMDLHLAHHLFPMVPHYRLPELNALLQRTHVYRENRTVVRGYLSDLCRAMRN